MPKSDAKTSAGKRERRFAVGWQKLTKKEFVEALALALLDKVRMHRSRQAERKDSRLANDAEP